MAGIILLVIFKGADTHRSESRECLGFPKQQSIYKMFKSAHVWQKFYSEVYIKKSLSQGKPG